MMLLKRPSDLKDYLDGLRLAGKTIGFVPTMGALHQGHISLIDYSRKQTDITVCSIFVNPTQFNDTSDFIRYPVTPEKDILLLEAAGTDLLFYPSPDSIYPGGTEHLARYELGHLEDRLEGKYRPGHFQGVCQVMHRLLQYIEPHQLFMGEKDYQQCMVVKKLIELQGLTTALHAMPTLREAGGLAMSSRNMRLTPEEKEKAGAIYQALLYMKTHLKPGSTEEVKNYAKSLLEQNKLRIDYVEIADADYLERVNEWDGRKPLVALIAAFMGEVRLIDNMKLGS